MVMSGCEVKPPFCAAWALANEPCANYRHGMPTTTPLRTARLDFFADIDRRAVTDAAAYEYARRLVRHRIVRYLTSQGWKKSAIAQLLDVSHTAIGSINPRKPLPPLKDPELQDRARGLARTLVEPYLPWQVPHGEFPVSAEIMDRHGVAAEKRASGRSDSTGREWQRVDDKLTIAIFTEARWDGVRTVTQPMGDSYSRWRILECRPDQDSGMCTGTHLEVSAVDLGVPPDFLNSVVGESSESSGLWPYEEVLRQVIPLVKERYGIVALDDMNLGPFDL